MMPNIEQDRTLLWGSSTEYRSLYNLTRFNHQRYRYSSGGRSKTHSDEAFKNRGVPRSQHIAGGCQSHCQQRAAADGIM